MKHLLVVVALVGSLVAVSATSSWSAVPKTAKVVIRHETRGCHSWSLNGRSWLASLSTSLARGAAVTIVDNDVMPHTFIQTSGPAAKFIGNAAMSHPGASVQILLSKPGTYRFTTKAGEDYMKGIKTTGEDNVLRLTVTVS